MAEVKQDHKVIILRPQDEGWSMGEDWVVEIPDSTTIVGLRDYIEKHRGIPAHRINIRFKSDMKLAPLNREQWPLRRFGVFNNAVFFVEPTLPGRGWYWNNMDYYIEKLLKEVQDAVEGSVKGRMSIAELEEIIPMPPPIKMSLKVFLRQYPEKFHIRSDITKGIHWVLIAVGYQLPSFEVIPVEVGTITQHEPPKFDWEGHKDVDDTKLATWVRINPPPPSRPVSAGFILSSPPTAHVETPGSSIHLIADSQDEESFQGSRASFGLYAAPSESEKVPTFPAPAIKNQLSGDIVWDDDPQPDIVLGSDSGGGEPDPYLVFSADLRTVDKMNASKKR